MPPEAANDVSASGNDGMINDDIKDKVLSETSHHIIISEALSYHHKTGSYIKPYTPPMPPKAANDVSASGNDGMINDDIKDKVLSETSHHIIISEALSYHHKTGSYIKPYTPPNRRARRKRRKKKEERRKKSLFEA